VKYTLESSISVSVIFFILDIKNPPIIDGFISPKFTLEGKDIWEEVKRFSSGIKCQNISALNRL